MNLLDLVEIVCVSNAGICIFRRLGDDCPVVRIHAGALKRGLQRGFIFKRVFTLTRDNQRLCQRFGRCRPVGPSGLGQDDHVGHLGSGLHGVGIALSSFGHRIKLAQVGSFVQPKARHDLALGLFNGRAFIDEGLHQRCQGRDYGRVARRGQGSGEFASGGNIHTANRHDLAAGAAKTVENTISISGCLWLTIIQNAVAIQIAEDGRSGDVAVDHRAVCASGLRRCGRPAAVAPTAATSRECPRAEQTSERAAARKGTARRSRGLGCDDDRFGHLGANHHGARGVHHEIALGQNDRCAIGEGHPQRAVA